MVNEESREPLSRPKFVVTFPEYGNAEIVTLGELDMPGGAAVISKSDRDRSDERGRRGYDRRGDLRFDYDKRGGGSRGYDRGRHRREDRFERDGGRKRSRSREGDSKPPSEKDLMEVVRHQEQEKSLSQGKSYASRPPTAKASLSSAGGRNSILPPNDDRGHVRSQQRLPPPKAEKESDRELKKGSPEEIAAIREKKRKLMAKYG